MKTGLCVTFFYPTEKQIKCIDTIADAFDIVYIYDNSEDNDGNLRLKFMKSSNINFFTRRHNDGLSVAFNKCCDKALEDKVDYLMFLDQDSTISKDDINLLFNKINDCGQTHNIGMIGPHVKYQTKEKKIKREFEKVNWVITAGCVLNMTAYREIGHFDENYFISFIEPDYACELSKQGYDIYCFNKAILKQELGESVNGRTIHKPFRHYYIHRNRLYFLKKQRKCLSFFQKCKYRLSSFFDYFRVLFIWPDKKENLNYLRRARIDYKNKNYGGLSE